MTETQYKKTCACGCNEPVRDTATYRPGHDSRHVSQVGHEIADVLLHESNATRRDKKVQQLLDGLPSDRLVNRANSIAGTTLIRESATGEATATPARPNRDRQGTISVGGRRVEAVMHADGSVTYPQNGHRFPASQRATSTFRED